MAKVEGLNRRGSRWYVTIIVPEDLRKVYDKDRVNPCLGTSDRKKATLLATLKRAKWLADFETKRSQANPSPIDLITPELSSLLAERVRATVLSNDDQLRTDLPLLAELVHARKEVQRNQTNQLRITPNAGQPNATRIDDLSGATVTSMAGSVEGKPRHGHRHSRCNCYLNDSIWVKSIRSFD